VDVMAAEFRSAIWRSRAVVWMRTVVRKWGSEVVGAVDLFGYCYISRAIGIFSTWPASLITQLGKARGLTKGTCGAEVAERGFLHRTGDPTPGRTKAARRGL